MASRRPKHCSCYFILIYYVSCNKVVLDCKFVYLIIIENTMGKIYQKVRGGCQTSADIGELMRSQEGSGRSSLRRASPTQGCTANEPME